MRIIAIVGIQDSGKTTTITSLIEAIRRKGKTVGTCQTMLSPAFLIDTSMSNTRRCRRAGSELTCTRAKGETAFLYPEELPLSKVLERYKACDYVLLEGDYFAPVPRIVCAQRKEDALMRMNTRTFAFAGRISTNPEIVLPLPCYNALNDADSLLRCIDQRIPDIMPCSLLDDRLPPVSGIEDDGFSSCDCHPRESKADLLQITYDGKSITLTAEQNAMLISWIKENNSTL